MTTLQEKFMDEAIRLAETNMERGHGGPFGCVIVKDGEIIASGYNEVLNNNDPTAHAEIVAIRRACEKLNNYQLEGCEIYTSCEPCPMCLGAIYWSRPGKVYYAASREDADQAGFDDKHIYRELCLPLTDRIIPFQQIMQQKVKDIFLTWTRMNLNIKY
ncbi:MAG: nucleoside deaminase [Bacteroidales bacterium]